MLMAQRYVGSVFSVALGVRSGAFTIVTNALYFIIIVMRKASTEENKKDGE